MELVLSEQDQKDLRKARDLIMNTDHYQDGSGEDYDTNIHRAAFHIDEMLDRGREWV